MKTFIYEDEDLLRKLYRIAQAGAVNERLLQNAAESMIDRLRQTSGPVQANGNPTPSDLIDLNSFNRWLKLDNATFNGQPVFNPPESTTPNKEALSAILQDLYNKSKNNPVYKAALGNLMDAANKVYGLGLSFQDISDAVKDINGNPVKPGPGGSKNLLNVKVDETAAAGGGTKVEQSGAAAGGAIATQEQKQTYEQLSANIHLLNGRVIDFNGIIDQVYQVWRFVGKLGMSFLYNRLSPIVSAIRETASEYSTATSKSNGVPDISISPTGDNELTVMRKLDSLVGRKYTLSEMATICECYSKLMTGLSSFLDDCSGDPALKNLQNDFDSQKAMADAYYRHFFRAAELFKQQISNNPGGPRSR